MRIYFALIGAAIILAAISGAEIAWDGAFALFNILDTQHPNVGYGRFTQIPLYSLVIAVSHVTSDLTILKTIFGLIYGGITLLALASSWWLVRHRQEGAPLFIWSALGIGLGTLPGQICAVCQSTLSVQLTYPVLLAILIRMPRYAIPIVMLLSAAIFFFHPIAIPLFALAGVLAFLMGLNGVESRRRMWLWSVAFVGLATLALVRFELSPTAYETGELSGQVLYTRFFDSFAGLPLIAIVFAWVAALLLLIQPWLESLNQFRGKGFILSIASLTVAGGLLIWWASDPHQWAQEVSFREWAPFVSLPFIIFGTVEVLSGRVSQLSRLDMAWRIRIVQVAGLIFFLVVSIQSLNWLSLTERLRGEMLASSATCISASSLPWIQGTPLDHWAITAYSLVSQSRSPEKLVMAGSGCTDESFLPGLLVAQFGPGEWSFRDWGQGWFDLQVLSKNLIAAEEVPPRCRFPITEGWYGIERSGADWQRWTNGRGEMQVLLSVGSKGTLSGLLVSVQQPNEVDIVLNGERAASEEITQPGWRSFGPIPLSFISGENKLEFVSRDPPIQIPGDSRELTIALKDPSLTLDDGTTICR